ncbi:unnamed protein product, partial [Prorocentrum cordatum]
GLEVLNVRKGAMASVSTEKSGAISGEFEASEETLAEANDGGLEREIPANALAKAMVDVESAGALEAAVPAPAALPRPTAPSPQTLPAGAAPSPARPAAAPTSGAKTARAAVAGLDKSQSTLLQQGAQATAAADAAGVAAAAAAAAEVADAAAPPSAEKPAHQKLHMTVFAEAKKLKGQSIAEASKSDKSDWRWARDECEPLNAPASESTGAVTAALANVEAGILLKSFGELMKDHEENPQSASDALHSMMDLVKVQSTSPSTALILLQRMHAARVQTVEVNPAYQGREARRGHVRSDGAADPACCLSALACVSDATSREFELAVVEVSQPVSADVDTRGQGQ